VGKIVSIGRNDLCSCGSGKKYKKCCLPRSNPHVVCENTHYIVGMEGIDQIPALDDRDEAFLCYAVLTNVFIDWERKSFFIKDLHLLIKSYPQISDLWALLVIGYYGMGMRSRAKKVLKQSCVRFPKNLTIKLLAYFSGVENPPHVLPFDLETITQIYIWGCIRLRRALAQSNHVLASDLLEEMVENARRCQQTEHWALVESIYEMGIEMELSEGLSHGEEYGQ